MDIQSSDQFRSLFTGVHTIAVVENASKPSTAASRDTPFDLQMLGYRILCIGAAGGETPGQPWYRSLNDVDSAQAVRLAEDFGLEVVTGRSFSETFAAWKRWEQASRRS